MSKSLPHAALAVVVTLVLVTAVWFLFPDEKPIPEALRGTLLQAPKPLTSFTLQDSVGRPFTLERLEGKWSLMFFGYTHCPDVCPSTLAILNAVSKGLSDDPVAADTQYLFVSVDPGRDTPAQLKEFLAYFNPDFLGVTGDKVQIDNLTGQLGILYLFDGDLTSDNYLVNHSTAIALVDPSRRLIGYFKAPHTPNGIIDTYRQIRAYFH